MSLCLLILRPDDAYIAGDSRVSVEMDDVHYRWHDKYSKIEIVDDYIIFKGGSADICNQIVDSFRNEPEKTISKLYEISKFEFNKFKNNKLKVIGKKETEVLLIILHMENKKPVVYYIHISDDGQYQLNKIKYQDNDNGIMDMIAGDPSGEVYKIYKSCQINFNNADNVFENYKKIYESVTDERIGGNLTFCHVSNLGIEIRDYQLKDSKPIRQLNKDYALSFLNYKNNVQGSLKINDQEALTNGKISTQFIESLEVGTNVLMGENAYISWDHVTNQPTASDIGAKPYDWMPSYGDITGIKPPTNADNTIDTIGSNRLTYIDQNGIYTGTLTAQQINAIQGITLGANATIQWASLPSLPTASQIGARSDTWMPTAADVGALPDTTVIPVIPSYIKSTYIDSTTVQSPTIIGGLITGSVLQTADTTQKRIVIDTEGITSYDGSYKSGFFAKAGTYSEGALGINHMGNSAMSIHWNGQGEGTFECGGNLHIHAGTGSYKTFFSGNVDFSGATVTGLQISTVAKFG